VAGCGSDKHSKPIPQAQVTALQGQLDSIERRFQQGGGACDDILQGSDTNVAAVQSALDQIPTSVSANVRGALRDSFQHLFDLVSSQCDTTAGQETAPQPSTPESTPTQPPAPTDTTQTDTTNTGPSPLPAPPGPGKKKTDKGGKGSNGNGGGAEAPSG
jgi:DNA-binding FrmR family transcriptional regulator